MEAGRGKDKRALGAGKINQSDSSRTQRAQVQFQEKWRKMSRKRSECPERRKDQVRLPVAEIRAGSEGPCLCPEHNPCVLAALGNLQGERWQL